MEIRDEKAAAGVSIVIPAYNEAAGIGDVVCAAIETARRLGRDWEVIVVDDASTDDTAAIARRAGARVLRHPYNRGYGNSLKTGIAAAAEEFVVICDGDGSYPIGQLPRLLEDAEQYDMIVGARTGPHFFGSTFKRIGRWCQLKMVSYVTGTKVPDANSGFRLLRRSLSLRYLDFVCSGFSFTTSITIALICEQRAVKFVEIPYEPRAGKSHVRYLRDTLRSLQIITHCVLRYNPLKAFLAVAALPLVAIPLLAIVPIDRGFAVLASATCFCTSILVYAMGMAAYCAGSTRSEQHIDAGVYSSVDQPAAWPSKSQPASVPDRQMKKAA